MPTETVHISDQHALESASRSACARLHRQVLAGAKDAVCIVHGPAPQARVLQALHKPLRVHQRCSSRLTWQAMDRSDQLLPVDFWCSSRSMKLPACTPLRLFCTELLPARDLPCQHMDWGTIFAPICGSVICVLMKLPACTPLRLSCTESWPAHGLPPQHIVAIQVLRRSGTFAR